MSEATTYDATGLPVHTSTSPPLNARRGHWLNTLKQVRETNHGKFWMQTKQELINEMQGILDRTEQQGGMTEGEERWYQQANADLKWVIDNHLGPYEQEQQRLKDGTAPHSTDDDTRNLRLLQRQPYAGRHFRELFGQVQDRHQFKSFNEFLGIIANNMYDPRMAYMAASSGMNETEGSAGGFLIPPTFGSRLLDSALESSVLFGRIRVEPMTTNEKRVSSFVNENNSDQTGTTGSAPFGLQLSWYDEGQPYTESRAATKSITLSAKKAGILVPFSRELSEDGGTTFAKQLEDVSGQAIAWGIDDAIINGLGAGRPLGILASPSTIVVPKESGQAAGTYVFENAVAQFSRMHPACLVNSIWIANPSALPQLLTMSVALGASGQWYPALTNTSGVYSLLGRPLYLSEKAAPLGTKGDVILCDPGQYILGLRQQISAQLSEHVKFISDEIVMRISARLDGKPAWSKPYTPKNGPTSSWATVVANR